MAVQNTVHVELQGLPRPENLYEWKNYIIATVVEADVPRIKKHFRESFYQDSIFSVNAGGYSEEYAEEADALWTQRIKENLSLIVTDSQTQDVAGVLIVSTHTKSTGTVTQFNFRSKVLAMKTASVTPLPSARLFDEYNVEKVANLGMTSVARKYRGQGISYELFRRAISILTSQKGFKLIKVTCASPYVIKVADKLGFKEVERLRLIDQRDEDGSLLVPTASLEDVISLAVLYVGPAK